MFGRNRFEARLRFVEEQITEFQTLKANLAQLATQLSSLRGSVNAKFSGDLPKQKKKQQSEEFRELTAEEQEFVNSLPPHELERIKNMDDDEE